ATARCNRPPRRGQLRGAPPAPGVALALQVKAGWAGRHAATEAPTYEARQQDPSPRPPPSVARRRALRALGPIPGPQASDILSDYELAARLQPGGTSATTKPDHHDRRLDPPATPCRCG